MSTQPRRLGKYELQERLGQGGMAEVWKAFDPQLRRYVAIKFLHTDLRASPDFIARFIREGQAIAALRHPNIVQVYDFQTSSLEDGDSLAYMVMDYIEGQTLAHYIRRTSQIGRFPSPREIVQLFTSISLAVDYAHQHGMFHRDIKPANILLDTRNTRNNPMGEPILTDFGIAKMVGAETLTTAGMSMGTPLYISPEQVQGKPGNEKSDLYSLGVVLYEVCAGSPPFHGDSPYTIMLQHVNNPPPPPSQVNSILPPDLNSVIAHALAKDPEGRFKSASAMTAALAQAFNMPIPEAIRQAISPLDAVPSSTDNMETLLASENAPSPWSSAPTQGASRLETALASGTTLSSQSSASTQGETRQATVPAASPLMPAAMRDTPRPSTPVSSQPPAGTPTAPPVTPVPQPAPNRQRNRLLMIAIPVVLFVVIVAGLGTFLLSRQSNSAGSGISTSIVGQASFISSGQLTAQNTPASNDGIQVRLEHVANPSSGHRYYAWLQNNATETTSILLGALTINNGVATLSYTDTQHRDLLTIMSNFLVTEESAGVTPNNPSLDKTQWRYTGSIPNAPSSRDPDHFSYLDHIRHLLSNEPNLQKLQLQGGVDYWFLNNIQQMQKSAIEVRDHVNVQFVRQQATNILYYLDGKCATQDLQNAPVQTVPENDTIAHATSIGLLDCPLLPEPPGHITHIGRHLVGIARSPGATAAQMQRASEINKDLNTVNALLQKVRADARQLAVMDDAHLSQAQTLRNDMVVQANNVLNGSVDPATGDVIPSVQQIGSTIELLANIDVTPYKAA